jgi:DNA-binding response OmpR family regulator
VGTTFTVRLPGVAGGAIAQERVLVVEDDPHDADLIVALASEAGVETEVVRSLDTGLAALHRAQPMAIVLDLVLPDGRGEAILAANRAGAVIVVSVEDDDGRTRSAGADAHMTKPIDGPVLVRWLRSVTEGKVADAHSAS